MASIRKRQTKYQVQIRRSEGKSISKSFCHKKDALEWARHMETSLDRAELPTTVRDLKRFSFEEIILRYRDEVSVQKKSHDSERYILNAFLRQDIVQIPLQHLTSADFVRYRAERMKAVKVGTVQRELSIIQHAIDVAINEWNVPMPENPLSKVKKLKVNNSRNRRLKDREWDDLLKASKETQNPLILPVIEFALETGMRRGEILSIEWDHVNFTTQVLYIPVTKNGYARTIPLSQKAVRLLQKHEEYDKPFDLTANALRMAWDRLVNRAGIKDLHFHDLRHEAISRFFERGLSIPEVALISGHRDYRMLYRYTHLKAEDLVGKL